MEHEKNEPRRRPPERNSRAAQAAQQRRDQRREQAHLEELRQKQRKRARHRTRRRINPGVWKRILIMAAVVAAVVLSMVLFFRVRSVEVTGSAYYTADEIRAACGVAQGDNLLTLSRARIAGNIMAELPYVSTVQVTRRLPDTLELTVTEYDIRNSENLPISWPILKRCSKASRIADRHDRSVLQRGEADQIHPEQ